MMTLSSSSELSKDGNVHAPVRRVRSNRPGIVGCLLARPEMDELNSVTQQHSKIACCTVTVKIGISSLEQISQDPKNADQKRDLPSSSTSSKHLPHAGHARTAFRREDIEIGA